MFANLPTVHGYPVLAFAQTETQSTGPCGIILVEKPDGEMVTAWYRLGDSDWCHGHYFYPHMMTTPEAKGKESQAAYADFWERARAYKGPRRKEIPEAVIELAKTVADLTDPENDQPDMDLTPEDARPLALAILEFTK